MAQSDNATEPYIRAVLRLDVELAIEEPLLFALPAPRAPSSSRARPPADTHSSGLTARVACPPVAADILSLVLDVGSYNTKGGFGGDATPKCVVPSVRAAPAPSATVASRSSALVVHLCLASSA